MKKPTIASPTFPSVRHVVTKSIMPSMLTITVLATIAVTAWKLRQQHDLAAPLLSYSFFTGTIVAILYRILNPLGWNFAIAGLGRRVAPIQSTKIWLLSESRRWLPGGIWGYTSRAVASSEIGLNKTVASASMAIELLLTIAAAICVSIAGIAVHYTELRTTLDRVNENITANFNVAAASILACVGIAVASWLFRKKLILKIRNVAQKFSSLREVNIRANWLATSFGYLILMTILNGAVNSVLLQAVSSSHVPFAAMVAATATAWVIGFFAFFSPGGILVREAALAALLLPWLPYETGFALAILSRFAQLIAEVVGMMPLIIKAQPSSVPS